jgi:hypothetical protein
MQLPEYLKGKYITSKEESVDAKKATSTKKKEE